MGALWRDIRRGKVGHKNSTEVEKVLKERRIFIPYNYDIPGCLKLLKHGAATKRRDGHCRAASLVFVWTFEKLS